MKKRCEKVLIKTSKKVGIVENFKKDEPTLLKTFKKKSTQFRYFAPKQHKKVVKTPHFAQKSHNGKVYRLKNEEKIP